MISKHPIFLEENFSRHLKLCLLFSHALATQSVLSLMQCLAAANISYHKFEAESILDSLCLSQLVYPRRYPSWKV